MMYTLESGIPERVAFKETVKKKKIPIIGVVNAGENDRLRRDIEANPIEYLRGYIWRAEKTAPIPLIFSK